MAEKLCTLRKRGGCNGGGSLRETTLWENSSPTSDYNNSPINLLQSIDNFDYIKIVCKYSKQISTDTSVIFEKNIFKTFANAATSPIGIVSYRVSSTAYARRFYYISDTSIGVLACGGVGSTASSTDTVIPYKIIGMK